MSDVTQAETTEAAEAPPSTIIVVPVVKGKGTIEIDTSMLPDEVYREALLQGLKVLANRGTSKVTKTTYPNEAELKAKAMKVAEAQKEAMYAGKIKITGAKSATKVSGAVKTEAMRLARNLVKDEMKKAGLKVSHYPASEITKAAKELLEGNDELIALATKNIAERETLPGKKTISLASLKADPKLVEAAEAKKANKGTLSAKQAGMVAQRSKGKGKPSDATAH